MGMAVRIPKTTTTWTVYSMKVALKLVELGYDILKYRPNMQDITKKVFIFRVNEKKGIAMKNFTYNFNN